MAVNHLSAEKAELKPKKIWLSLQAGVITVLWAAAFFETDLAFFSDKIGVTIFMAAGLVLCATFFAELILKSEYPLQYGQCPNLKKLLLLALAVFVTLTILGVVY